MSTDALYTLVREGFTKIPDYRDPRSGLPLADAQMLAFAMFSLTWQSLLAFAFTAASIRRRFPAIVFRPEIRTYPTRHPSLRRGPVFRGQYTIREIVALMTNPSVYIS